MSISVDQLLKKIESELHMAKQAGSTAKLRENVHSMKVLCEIILEENHQSESIRRLAGESALQPVSPVLPVTSLSVKKLEEEEANGDSLFEF
jgi:hypothetical protein